MATIKQEAQLTLVIKDDNYMLKAFTTNPTDSISTILSTYRLFICQECSTHTTLDFYLEAIKLTNQPISTLNIKHGDYIDVRIPHADLTRGRCPLPPTQTAPNLHYLDTPRGPLPPSIKESDVIPEEVARSNVLFESITGVRMVYVLKRESTLQRAFEEFARVLDLPVQQMRVEVDGMRVLGRMRVRDLADEDGEIMLEDLDDIKLEVRIETFGGGS